MQKLFRLLIVLFCFSATGLKGQNCQASFIYSSTTGNTVQFMDSSWSSTGNLSYVWHFGNGDSSILSNPVYTYGAPGVYSVCLHVFSSTGCHDVFCDSVFVGVNPPCNVSYSYFADTSNHVYFTSSVQGTGPFNYSWNFGDGSPINTQANPTHQYNAPGIYGVSLNVSFPNGFTCNYIDTVYVNDCTPYFQYTIGTNGVVNFNNYSSTSRHSSYSWNFGDGNTSSLKHPVHTYTSSGTYTVSLTSFDSLSNCTNTFYDSLQITLPPSCTTGFTYSVNQGDLFITNTASNFSSILYDFGDGITSNQINPNHTYLTSGQYVVCQTITNSNTNCSKTLCDTIQILITPPVLCKAEFSYSLIQGNLLITNNATNYTNVTYDFGDGNTSTKTNPSHTYTTSGTYVVCQVINNISGNNVNTCSDIYCDTISVNIPLPCNAFFAYNTSEDSLFITDLSNSADSILYDFGDGNTSTDRNPQHIYSNSGTYMICQTVYGANNCIDVYCDSATITIPCEAGFSYQQQGDSLLFTNLASNFTSISYDFGDGNTSSDENPIHLFVNSGTYTVTQTVLNINQGCVDTFSETITVNISTSCVAKFLTALDTNDRETLYLVNVSTNDNSHQYSWSFGDGTFGSGRLPSHFYDKNIAHEVCLTITDTVMNCTSTFCDTIGLDTNGQIIKANGYFLKVLEGDFIGIEDNQNNLNSIDIYPNPFVNSLQFVYNGQDKLQYRLQSITGKTIKEGVIENNEIMLPDINIGMYILQITDGVNTVTKKLVKQEL